VLLDVELDSENVLVVDVEVGLEGVIWLISQPLNDRNVRTSNVRLGKKEGVVLFCETSG
jgi:hypothetical protein